MNIAILMSGRVERFNWVVDLNKNNLIQPLLNAGHNVDMFGSFWDEDDTESCIHAFQPHWKVTDIETLTPFTGGVVNNFNEHQERIKKYQHDADSKVSNTLYWLYKLNRLYKIVKQYERVNNTKYDYYVRIRPDVGLRFPFKVEHLNNLTDDNIITHVDRVVNWSGKLYGCGDGWIDDNFCIAKQYPFEVYCSVYDDIISLCDMCQNCISHLLLKKQFELKNIKTLLPNSSLIMSRKMPTGVQMFHYFEHVYPDFDVTQFV